MLPSLSRASTAGLMNEQSRELMPIFHEGLSPSRSIQSRGSRRIGAWGHGDPIDLPFLSETDAPRPDEDMEEAMEEQLTGSLALQIPLDAPWDKQCPSIWDRTLRRAPERAKALGGACHAAAPSA